MNWIAKFVIDRQRLAWVVFFALAGACAYLAGEVTRGMREDERLLLLETEISRRSVEIMSQTLNGNLIGSMAMLGLTDTDIKSEARGGTAVNGAKNLGNLEIVGRSYGADGVFVVMESGTIGSSWDNSGKRSTGLDVRFRPYYQMAMQGKPNVYAAVSLARGDRALYFSAPIFSAITTSGGAGAIGAVVARTGLSKIDGLLRDKADIALLLSPQGVVFASSRAEWIGFLAGAPTPERLNAIRALKQFGNMFEKKEPSILPVATDAGRHTFEGKRYAVATARMQWNDPSGDWKLVMMEDLSRSIPAIERLRVSAATAALLLILGWMTFHLLRSQHRQVLAGEQLSAFSRDQQASAERKAQLAACGLLMQRAKRPAELVQSFLGVAHRQLGALQGVVYLVDPASPNVLLWAGGYACNADDLPSRLELGEGLLGQCAIDRRVHVLATAPDGFGTIRSGLGATRPAAVLLTPILLNDVLLGVVELALLKQPDDAEREQFAELTGLLAINLEILSGNVQTEEVLMATRAAEQANAEQLAFQQVLIDTIPYPVFYKDAEARFLGVNRAYEQTFNIGRADVVGKRVLDLDYLPEADRVAYQTEDEATIATAATLQREMKIPFADGELHDTLYFVSGFRKPDGAPGGLVGTFIDINAIKSAERELERMTDVERFNRLANGREQRILELKQQVNALAQAAGQPLPYSTTLVETVGDHDVPPHPDYRTDLALGTGQLGLVDLVDVAQLQTLFSAYCEAMGIAAAIIDLGDKVLASYRWERVWTDFHRRPPESSAPRSEGDTAVVLKLPDGQDFTLYQCKNGMTDCSAPIIVEGRHLANVFIGQFHLELPDMDLFRRRTRQLGYPEAEYLQAVADAPVVDERRLPVILGFLSGFARLIATMSLAQRRADAAQARLQEQAQLLRQERLAAMSLAEDNDQARRALADDAGQQP